MFFDRLLPRLALDQLQRVPLQESLKLPNFLEVNFAEVMQSKKVLHFARRENSLLPFAYCIK